MFVMISVAPLVIYLRAYQIFPMLPIKFLRYEAIKHDLVIKREKKNAWSQIISQSCAYVCLACLDRNCGAINYVALCNAHSVFSCVRLVCIFTALFY